MAAAVPPRILRVVASFLEQRSFRVTVDGALSSAHPIRAGVPQGSCLSPVLYGWYTDDIPCTGATLALYADDAAYVTTSLNATSRMQRVLDELPHWLASWRIRVNVAKTQALVIGHNSLPPPLTLQGQEIAWSSSATYLGVVIDRRLTLKPQAAAAASKAAAATNLLRPILASSLPLRQKVGVYKAYIRPHLTYATPAWYAFASRPQRHRLQVAQQKALRIIVSASRYVRNDVIQRDLGIESVESFIEHLAQKLYAKAALSDHHEIRNIAPWHARPPDRRPLPRDVLPAPSPD